MCACDRGAVAQCQRANRDYPQRRARGRTLKWGLTRAVGKKCVVCAEASRPAVISALVRISRRPAICRRHRRGPGEMSKRARSARYAFSWSMRLVDQFWNAHTEPTSARRSRSELPWPADGAVGPRIPPRGSAHMDTTYSNRMRISSRPRPT